jgi:hypothetical protein
MRRTLVLMLTIVAAFALAAAGLADPGDGGKVKKRSKLTITTVSEDHGSCQNVWALDTLQRTLLVKKNDDGDDNEANDDHGGGNGQAGTFTVTRRDRGTFVTAAGQSPGACDTTGRHGHVIVAGVKGKVEGFLRGTVTGGTFNPNATCNAACASMTATLIKAFFGPNANFSCQPAPGTGSTDCKFNFNYTARARGNPPLQFRHWQDKGKGAGTLLKEEFSGDIAVS